MDALYITLIADKLGCKPWQVENCLSMLDEGDTVPFISRYRKEQTGGMNDAQVAEAKHLSEVYTALQQRKETVISTIEQAGAMTPELRKQIADCTSSTILEDLYLPYRPKRQTKATQAAAKGLTPLADALWNLKTNSPADYAKRFVTDEVRSVEAALQGARDIVAERLSENAAIRDSVRNIYRKGKISSTLRKAALDKEEANKWKSYFSFSYPLARIPAHNLLALLRGENEGILNLKLQCDRSRCEESMLRLFLKGRPRPQGELGHHLKLAIEDALSRLLDTSITTEVIKEAKAKADEESVQIFGENLKQLLLEPPLGEKRVLAIDPGFRNGCKCAVLDSDGSLLYHTIIHPHPPQSRKVESLQAIQDIAGKYHIEAVALGNGTAGRETAEFLRKVSFPDGCSVHMVSEDGASIYSASEAARKEFPNEDVTVRGAVSIGRRLMDPLAELVKIDPKNLGIGQYQHDVDQKLLREKLEEVVEYCVNLVGVNLGTASAFLLAYVSGIGPSLADNIVSYRTSHGGFGSREELLKVPRLGALTYRQCAGFLRVKGSGNPLDNSAVHPESYPIVDKMAADLGVSTKQLVGNAGLCAGIKADNYISGTIGLPTITDIIEELKKPGRDPREGIQEFHFSKGVHEISDLREGMELQGIVTNITAFGAFVDIGVHENGLIHLSQMGHGHRAEPSRVLKLHQKVKVEVIGVDLERSRISLKLI